MDTKDFTDSSKHEVRDYWFGELNLSSKERQEMNSCYEIWYERTQGTSGIDDAFLYGFKAAIRYMESSRSKEEEKK